MAKDKKLKLHSQGPDAVAEEKGSLSVPPPRIGLEPSAQTRSVRISLADIRASTLKTHTEIAHTIADLEAWRAEIDATIAFLKARSR